MKKRFFAALLCAVMVLALLPGAAMAAPVSPDPNPAGNTIDTISVNDTLGVNNGTVTTNNGAVAANYGTVTTNNGTVYNYSGGIVSTNGASGGIVYCMGGTMELSGGLARNDGILIIPAGYTLTIGLQLHNAGRIHNFGTIAGNELISHERRGAIINYTGGVIEPTVVVDGARIIPAMSPVITLDPVSQTVAHGGSATFTATVSGTISPAQTVTWAVEGGTASTIDANGKLTVAATETASTLTVRATLTVDTTKSATATVTVTTMAVATPDIPQTGDGSTPALWLGIMLAVGAGLCVSAVLRRKRA